MFYVPLPKSNVEISDKLEMTHTYNNYETELKILCEKNGNTAYKYALSGNLRSSKMRSIFWRTFLGIFPISSTTSWLNSVKESRKQYNEIKTLFDLDPRQTSCLPNDNPLSQDKNSIWYRYFCDKELKRIIQQDVIRTSPEKQFFQSPQIQEMMINILFLYARRNPVLCYRQGMHELLAPILFVLHEDYYTYNIEKSGSVINSILTEIMNLEFLEHDVFHLFSYVMDHMGQYYQINCAPNESGHLPIQIDVECDFNENALNIRLNELRNDLMKYDQQLHNHLKFLNIPFTAFGIRWIRLLFGREFLFSDLLILWDAIFVMNSDFVLVSYVLLAMLILIREKLLNSDYAQCLNYLMKYPSTVDVLDVVNYAVYLKEPTIYPKSYLLKIKNIKCDPLQSLTDKNYPKANNDQTFSKQKTSSMKRLKNMKINVIKKTSKNNDHKLVDDYSSKTFEMVISELKHMRVVMSLCKLKLFQYHETLTASITQDDVKAQQALTGIQELCTLLDIDYFSLKSCSNVEQENVETGREAREISNTFDENNAQCFSHPSADVVSTYLPPPNTDIDMTIFSQSEFEMTDKSRFPPENPLKLSKPKK